jgi:hypothetical protein
MADWRKRRANRKKSGIDYVTLIPRYPTTPEDYARCIEKWMNCHRLATEMNSRGELIAMLQQSLTYVGDWPQYVEYLNTEIARLQKEQAENVGVLSALISAYEGCMDGMQT